MSERKPEHGTIQAYVTGYLLSLVFTFVAYYMVKNQTATGNKLLAVILTLGVLQMMVQLLFFLHLGRKPRPRWQLVFLASTVFAVLVVIGGSIIITTNLNHNMTATQQVLRLANDEGIYQVDGHKTGACEGQNPNHQIMIMDGMAMPSSTSAHKCDTVSFLNHTSSTLHLAFGTPANPTPYAGEDGYAILAGQAETISLSVAGTYHFYDAKSPTITGSFSVGNR